MKPVIIAPLVALALAGGGAGAYFWVTSGGAVEEAAVAQPTHTPTPTATGAAAATSTPTPTAEPGSWATYRDPVLGFSLDYPPDLIVKDITGPSPDGLNERAIEFRSSEDTSRAFVISVSANTRDITLEQWAIEYAACRTKSIQESVLGGIPALACTREVVEGRPGPAVLADHGGKIFLMSGHLPDSEFSQLRETFSFSVGGA